jgi:hypothetical protein
VKRPISVLVGLSMLVLPLAAVEVDTEDFMQLRARVLAQDEAPAVGSTVRLLVDRPVPRPRKELRPPDRQRRAVACGLALVDVDQPLLGPVATDR